MLDFAQAQPTCINKFGWRCTQNEAKKKNKSKSGAKHSYVKLARTQYFLQQEIPFFKIMTMKRNNLR